MTSQRFRAPSLIAMAVGVGTAALLGSRARRAKARSAERPGGDPAHAAGHRHLPPVSQEPAPPEAEQGSYTVVSHHPGHVHKG